MKKYYAEREQILNPIDFDSIRYSFFLIYNQFFYDNWFAEAKFTWAISDPKLFLFRKLGYLDIWPFRTNILLYDEARLFSVIEFLYEYVYNNTINGQYRDIVDGQKEYRNMVNDILRFYNEGYELSDDGEIFKLSPPGFETLIKETVKTSDPKNIDLRVKYAISKFAHYNSSVEDRKEAVRTLADVLEYLKNIDIRLPTDDEKNLFHIINKFDIRHLNRSQQSDYDKDIWYDWMFYTFLASIRVLLELNNKRFD